MLGLFSKFVAWARYDRKTWPGETCGVEGFEKRGMMVELRRVNIIPDLPILTSSSIGQYLDSSAWIHH